MEAQQITPGPANPMPRPQMPGRPAGHPMGIPPGMHPGAHPMHIRPPMGHPHPGHSPYHGHPGTPPAPGVPPHPHFIHRMPNPHLPRPQFRVTNRFSFHGEISFHR